MKPFALLLLSLLSSGCAIGRFLGVATLNGRAPLEHRLVSQPEHADCLLVMMPGIGDAPERFSRHGFVELASEYAPSCDVRVLDMHFGYYRDANVVSRLSTVLEEARPKYAQVWLVGVSLGGYGAALTARERPELVDGVVLISPFVGLGADLQPLLRRVEAGGGLEHFKPTAQSLVAPKDPRKHFRAIEPLWGWLAERARDEAGPEVWVAWGQADGLAPALSVVGDAFDERAVSMPGGHDWDTFAKLFRQVAASTPWES